VAETSRRLWPFSTKSSLVSAGMILVGLPILLAILRQTSDWPGDDSETEVLLGILVLSLMPILLVLLDSVIERGGVIEYRGIKVDFSQSRAVARVGITVPPNIGVQGKALTDSDTAEILATLKQATASDVVIIDLEDGQAWWETRLMVLLSGAQRLGRPNKVVFVGTEGGKEQQFQGWAYSRDLYYRFVREHPEWEPMVQAARAANRQWELVEPVNPVPPVQPGSPPGQAPALKHPTWFGTLATNNAWMTFQPAAGLHNELFAEQVLQSELGSEVELKDQPKGVSLVRLEEIFRPILIKDRLDLSWTTEKQLTYALELDAPFVALTRNGTYSALVSKVSLLNEVVKSLIEVRTNP
jgi:hypothetical protein